ncbi:MAG: gluconate 2-dehydrogenase subunit 3 family protein [Gammaproteobacteria bacterium]|nr:MAG: gluconate 2-dehydrogenase subunit 3 family protein [Gammaproteobacteria bacterium]
MKGIPVDRREVLKAAALILGAAVSPSCRRALETGVDLSAPPRAGALSADQQQAIAALAELIIPQTDTPGALEAQVPEFIHHVVVDWYTEAERQIFLEGLAELEASARVHWSRSFLALQAAQQAQLLSELEPPMEGLLDSDPIQAVALPAGASGDLPFYVKLKELTVLGYYTSRAAAGTELDYQPVPGRYDGDARFRDRQWVR